MMYYKIYFDENPDDFDSPSFMIEGRGDIVDDIELADGTAIITGELLQRLIKLKENILTSREERRRNIPSVSMRISHASRMLSSQEWDAFCEEMGLSVYCLNEGQDGEIQVPLPIIRKFRLVV